jgi:hypothetical protein
MPDKRLSVKNERQYEALKDEGMSKERAARIANSPGASSRGGEKSGSGGNSKQGGTTAQKKAAGRKGGNASARGRGRRSKFRGSRRLRSRTHQRGVGGAAERAALVVSARRAELG